MADPIPKDKSERLDSEALFDAAIGNGLTGYANDGGKWLLGKHVFQDALERGERADDALYLALNSAGENAESSPEEAAQKFWKTLPIDKAVSEALRGYAKDGGAFQLGEWVFNESLKKGVPVEESLNQALEAAKDGAESHPGDAAIRFWRTIDPSYVERASQRMKDGVKTTELIHRGWMKKGLFAGTYLGEKSGEPLIVKQGKKESLEKEREVLSSINYPGIPKVIGYLENEIHIGGLTRLSIEKMKGKNFAEYANLDGKWKSRPLDSKIAASITVGLTRCFEAVSDGGYLYRDLNPAHIMIHGTSVGLIDLEASARKDEDGKARMTDPRGTWETMSPEEFEMGGTITEASNVYSLGCMLYQMVAGNNPFSGHTGPTADEAFAQAKALHEKKYPAPIEGPLGEVITKALHPDPNKRYATLQAFRRAVQQAA